MNLRQLFEAGFGLFDVAYVIPRQVKWFEVTAKEAGLAEDDEEDYDCYGLTVEGLYDTDFFNCNSEVIIADDKHISIVDMSGKANLYTIYRPVKTSELVS